MLTGAGKGKGRGGEGKGLKIPTSKKWREGKDRRVARGTGGKNYPHNISAHKWVRSEIPTPMPTFSGSSIPKKRVTMLSNVTGSRKSNMAADKPEISRPIYQRTAVIVLHLKRYTDFLWK